MKIEVRPIETKSWHGKAGKENFSRPKTVQALVDGRTRKYATGLSPEDVERLGKLGNWDLSDNAVVDKAHPFWDSPETRIKLENHTMFFDTDLPLEEIKVKIMRASSRVANSMKEYEEGLFPKATHVISDEREEVEVLASKIALKKKATIASAKLSRTVMNELILILDGKVVNKQSTQYVEVALDMLIQKDPKGVLRLIAMDKKERYLHALVLEAINKNVLKKVGHKIFYHDSNLGNDVYDVVAYLGEEDNQALKVRIMSAIDA